MGEKWNPEKCWSFLLLWNQKRKIRIQQDDIRKLTLLFLLLYWLHKHLLQIFLVARWPLFFMHLRQLLFKIKNKDISFKTLIPFFILRKNVFFFKEGKKSLIFLIFKTSYKLSYVLSNTSCNTQHQYQLPEFETEKLNCFIFGKLLSQNSNKTEADFLFQQLARCRGWYWQTCVKIWFVRIICHQLRISEALSLKITIIGI